MSKTSGNAAVITKSVCDKIAAGDYTTKLTYPSRPKKPAIFHTMISDLTADEIVSFAKIKVDFETAEHSYKNARDEYYADQNYLERLFRIELESENGMRNHPKADLLWSKAWEMGHSSGLSEVYNYYVDLVELVK